MFGRPSEEALQDCSLLALLRKIYGAVRLAIGPLCDAIATSGADGLRTLLGDVMPLLLRVAVPAGEEDGRRLDLLGACGHPSAPPLSGRPLAPPPGTACTRERTREHTRAREVDVSHVSAPHITDVRAARLQIPSRG